MCHSGPTLALGRLAAPLRRRCLLAQSMRLSRHNAVSAATRLRSVTACMLRTATSRVQAAVHVRRSQPGMDGQAAGSVVLHDQQLRPQGQTGQV